jgi:hypothetical protein
MTPRPLWPAVWVGLLGSLALPLPFNLALVPERGAIIAYMLVAAGLLLLRWVGRASWPVALFLGWTLAHVLWAGVPIRGFQVLFVLVMAALLYVEAAALSEVAATRCAWALVVGVAIQGILGGMNLFEFYPSPNVLGDPLRWLGVTTSQGTPTLLKAFVGKPMGWLTHPNFWGAYLALGVPVVYALGGRWWALLVVAGTVATGNIGPVVSGAAGLALMSWRDLPSSWRPVMGAALVVLIVAVSVQHIQRPDSHGDTLLSTATSGRTAVWANAWPDLRQHWVVGNGPGSWRLWSIVVNEQAQKAGAIGSPVTMQAHNEPLQLWFEFGLVGVALVGWWVWRLSRGAWVLMGTGQDRDLMWVGVAIVAAVNSLGSPTFHMPQQAIVALFAAGRLHAASQES